jgi:hypothetical protein
MRARLSLVRSGVALVLATTAIGAGVLVACASFDAEVTPGGDASPDSALGADGGGGDASAPVCPAGGFCDSFDDDEPLPRAWGQIQTMNAALDLVPDAGMNGSGALVATVKNDNNVQAAFLRLDLGQNGPPSYTAVLAFSANVMTTGTGFLLGPRYRTDLGPPIGQHEVLVDFHGGSTRLEHETPSCDGGCALPNKDTPISAGWHRYVLTMKVRPFDGTDYGDVDYSVDGMTASSGPLTFSLSSPKTYGLEVGVTYSNGHAGGTIAFDDVSLVIQP